MEALQGYFMKESGVGIRHSALEWPFWKGILVGFLNLEKSPVVYCYAVLAVIMGSAPTPVCFDELGSEASISCVVSQFPQPLWEKAETWRGR